jgi:hypothetical protein
MKEEGFEAVFIGSGAGLPRFMGIEGENLKGVYSANEFLTRINLMKAYKEDSKTPIFRAKRVAVCGGGNVAMDAARSALRLGADEVYIVYRRGESELPARAEEVEHAKEEGVIFKLLTNPVKILKGENGMVGGMECVEMTLGEPDASGRRRPVVKEGSEFVLDVDCVIMAIGTSPNPLIKSTTEGLDTEKWGGIIADENGLTDDLLERSASFWNAEPERTLFLFAYGLTEAERAELADALHVKTERVHLDTTATDVADFVYRLVWVHQRRTVYLVTGDECFIPGIYLANKAGLTVYGLAQDPSEWETVRTKEANLRAFWRDLLGVSYTPDEPETET